MSRRRVALTGLIRIKVIGQMAHGVLLVAILLNMGDGVVDLIEVEIGKAVEVTLVGELGLVGRMVACREVLILLGRLAGRVLLLVLLVFLLGRFVEHIVLALVEMAG